MTHQKQTFAFIIQAHDNEAVLHNGNEGEGPEDDGHSTEDILGLWLRREYVWECV